MVGVERFELPTSWSQTRRATRLRYTPERAIIYLPIKKRSILRLVRRNYPSTFLKINRRRKQLCPQTREISSAFQFVPLDQRVGRMIMDGFKIFRLHHIGFYAGVAIQYRCRITYHVLDKFGIVVGLFSHMLFV